MKKFGPFLFNLRSSSRLTLKELTQLVNSNTSDLSRLENNDIPQPFRGKKRQLVIALAEILCTSKSEIKKFLELAEIDQSLLSETEQLQVGFTLTVPHSSPEETIDLERLVRIYKNLLTNLETKQTLLGNNHPCPNLRLKIQEYTDTLDILQNRLNSLYSRQKPESYPLEIKTTEPINAQNNDTKTITALPETNPHQYSPLALLTDREQELLASLLTIDSNFLTGDLEPNGLDMSRRILIGHVLTMAKVSLSLLPTIHQYNNTGSSMINDELITFLEKTMATYWELYHTGGATRVLQGLEPWIREMTKLTRQAQGTIWHKRTLTLLTMGYQLQSCVLRDIMRYDQAHMAYQRAFHIAQELDNPELIAAALAREGVTLIQQDKPKQAIIYLDGALNSIEKRTFPKLRGHILQALSEAAAKAQQPQECWNYIGQAEDTQEEDAEEHSLIRFNRASVIAQRGIDALLLGEYQDAITILDKSLTTYDPTLIRGRARLLAQKAEAYYRLNAKEECIINAREALTLGQSAGSSKTIARVHNLYTILTQSSWGKDQGIIQLGEMLSTR